MTVLDAAEPAAGSKAATALGTLGLLTKSPKIQKAIAAYLAGTALYSGSQTVLAAVQHRLRFTVSVRGDDEIYTDLHAWLLDEVDPARVKSLELRSPSGPSYVDPDADDDEPEPTTMERIYSSGQSQKVVIDGHRVSVRIEHDEFTTAEEKKMFGFLARFESIIFVAYGIAGRLAVEQMIQELRDQRAKLKRRPELYMATRWGDWMRRRDLPERSLSTVVLREGQRDDIVSDLQDFLDNETLYNDLGMPWHRGYLFSGPPGMGKTSMVRALATHFGMNLYFMPLGDVNHDTDLLNLVARVKPRSILLLEDIDVFHAATEDNEEKEKVSLSGLLNALDGVSTPHGLITILTSNKPEKLEDALIRPGRIDRHFNIDFLDDGQLQDIAHTFLGEGIEGVVLGDRQVSAIEIIEVLKANHLDAVLSGVAIRSLVSERVSA